MLCCGAWETEHKVTTLKVRMTKERKIEVIMACVCHALERLLEHHAKYFLELSMFWNSCQNRKVTVTCQKKNWQLHVVRILKTDSYMFCKILTVTCHVLTKRAKVADPTVTCQFSVWTLRALLSKDRILLTIPIDETDDKPQFSYWLLLHHVKMTTCTYEIDQVDSKR